MVRLVYGRNPSELYEFGKASSLVTSWSAALFPSTYRRSPCIGLQLCVCYRVVSVSAAICACSWFSVPGYTSEFHLSSAHVQQFQCDVAFLFPIMFVSVVVLLL